MHTTIAELDIQRLGVNTIDVGQVAIGPIQIGQLVVTDLNVNTSAAGAELRNFRVTVTHGYTLDWRIHIEIPAHEDIDQGGTEDLGQHSFTINFGDVSVPGLESFRIAIGSVTADTIAATASPVGAVQLGSAVAEQIQLRNLVLPSQGFSIAGLGIGTLGVRGVGVPAASLDTFGIGRLHVDAFPLGQLTLSNLALPSASIANINSQAVDVTARPRGKALHVDLGCLDLTLKISCEARAQLDELLIRDASASASVGRIELNNVVAPYELLNLTLSQIGIETLQVPTVAVA